MPESRSTSGSLSTGRRRAVLLVACALVATGCGAVDETEADGNDQPRRTVDHIYGSTEIIGVPERVVTIGGNAGDLPVSLGVTPVGITSEGEDFGADEAGLQPWLREELDSAGAGLPDATLLNESWELEFERIAALRPDVILATRGWIEKQDYEVLSDIAPTVGPLLEQGNGGDWRDELRITADVLGVEERADDVIAQVEATVSDARAEHPDLEGATVLWSYEPAEGQVQFLSGDYIGLDTFELFGMTEDPSIATSSADAPAGEITATISQENLPELQTDIYFVIDQSMKSLEAPLVARWEPVAEGRYLRYDDLLLDSAVYSASPLALGWLVEESELLDQLEQALDGEAVVRRADQG